MPLATMWAPEPARRYWRLRSGERGMERGPAGSLGDDGRSIFVLGRRGIWRRLVRAEARLQRFERGRAGDAGGLDRGGAGADPDLRAAADKFIPHSVVLEGTCAIPASSGRPESRDAALSIAMRSWKGSSASG